MADALAMTMLGVRGAGQAIGTATSVALDAAADAVAFVFQAKTADAITAGGFRYGVRTGTPPTYSIALEGVGGDGLPNGTDVGGGSPTLVTFTPPADTSIDGLWQWKNFTNSFTPSVGQLLALVIRYSSGTVDASNNSTITHRFATSVSGHFPYALTNTTGTFAKDSNAIIPTFGYKTASTRCGNIIQGSYTGVVSTSGHRSCMHLTLPSTHGSTQKVKGLVVTLLNGSAGGQTHTLGVWDGSGTALQTLTIDTDQFSTAGGNVAGAILVFSDATLDALSYGSKYYFGVERGSAGNIGLRGIQLAEAEDRSAFAMGTIRGLSTWNGSAWSDDDTVLPFVELLLDDITVPSGSGGGGYVIGS